MSENETNPQQRPGGTPAEDTAHRWADGPADASAQQRAESDTTAQLPTGAAPHDAAGGGPHEQPVPQPPSAPHPPAGQPPWQQPPAAAQPYPPSWQPPYGGPHQPGGQPYGGDQTAAFHQHGHPGAATGPLPPLAAAVGPAPADRRPGRGRKLVTTGAAALLLALLAGGAGAATALAIVDDGGPAPTTRSGSSSVTRVVDRSSLAEIADQVQDSVVSISTGGGEGSGVVLTADGYVLTNNHVVENAQGNRVRVVFADGKSADATIVGTDPRTDLAVVKAEGVSGLSPASFGDSAAMQVGDTVLALGSPLGLEGSVTAGIVSAKDRILTTGGGGQPRNPFQPQQQQGAATLAGLLQTDAPINPGNSGGALVNTNAEVIGINTAIATSGQGNTGNIGVGFAIPSNKAKQVADALMKGQKVSHPFLGVSVAETEQGGAVVRSVVANGPAAQAGLQQGDVITEVNGRPINDSDDVVGAVQAANVGDRVQITYSRNGQVRTVTATLAEAP